MDIIFLSMVFLFTPRVVVLLPFNFIFKYWLDIAVALGFILFYTLSGYISFIYALRLRGTSFYTTIFSSILFRLGLMLAGIFWWVRFHCGHKTVFLLALVAGYTPFLFLEINRLNRILIKEHK